MTTRIGRICLVVAALAVAACGGDGGIPGDGDNDGFLTEDGDCDDSDRTVYPGAPDPCDGVDNDCDGMIDPGFDNDEDGYSSCGGDCRDNDPSSHPDGVEVIDGLDNDCDDIADNHTDQYDDDGDGYSEDNGDCDDSEGGVGELIGPD
ncbi:MAG TPA: putative metal-binding motif-containing protein, partial [Kofleriaceae bacterium]|nr:putative metal-binding motif-containing protein [Kofleriaceae bacterium]